MSKIPFLQTLSAKVLAKLNKSVKIGCDSSTLVPDILHPASDSVVENTKESTMIAEASIG